MNKQALCEARGRLEAFVDPLLPFLGRLERRRWGAFYVQGLLLEGGRKTAAGMAERYGGNEQALQQFVSQSPWKWMDVRRELAARMAREAGSRVAWVLDDTGFPKKGQYSVGVARQYSGTLGKVGNCQIGVSLNYATDEGCFPIDFQLYLPQAWTEDRSRRRMARIPEEVTFRRKWELGLQMIDRALEWGLPVGVVVTDAGYGVTTELRAQLRKRGLSYVVGIPGEVGVWQQGVEPEVPAYQGRGRPRTRPRNLPAPESVAEVARRVPEEAWTEVTWREGTKGPLRSRFAALRVQPSHGHVHGRVAEPIGWLLSEWPQDVPAPTKFWLSNLPEDTTLRDLVYWAKIRWWVEQNYQQLKEEIGLDHFEGRSWVGWHHHVTLAMVAFDFLVLEGFRSKTNFWVDPPTRPARASASAHRSPWFLSPVPAEDCL
ncbi:MAG: IS701 family transposase [Candidatus Bipolaricaulota bacterium]